MPSSDNEIIKKIQDRAKHYYAQLVDRYKDRAFTLAVRMLKKKEDAEEATQDAFIRACNALNRFEGKARFGTWFYRILYNVCLRFFTFRIYRTKKFRKLPSFRLERLKRIFFARGQCFNNDYNQPKADNTR